jgi:hypothetical protein
MLCCFLESYPTTASLRINSAVFIVIILMVVVGSKVVTLGSNVALGSRVGALGSHMATYMAALASCLLSI